MKENVDVQGKVFAEIARAFGMGAIVMLASEKVNKRLENTREAAKQLVRGSLKRAKMNVRYGRSRSIFR